jgi:adenine-specific DNA-methyltransferase
MGKSVTYNDNLRFNYLIGKALIENQEVVFTEQDIQNILQYHPNPTFSFIQDTFNGIYYLNDENVWLDNICGNIYNMNHYPEAVLEYKRAIAFYGLFQSSLIKRPFNLFHRNNLNIRTNDVERTFGNKTAWDKPFETHFRKFINEANSLIFDSKIRCESLNKSVLDFSNHQFDLVYLDPPYISKNGSKDTLDYLKCYHFLEGMSNYQRWNEFVDFNSSNLRFKKDLSVSFTKITARQSFEQIFSMFRNSIIVLSYKKGGVPSIESLIYYLKKFKSKVYVRSNHYQYALNKQNGDSKNNREFLIIGI